MAQSSVQLLNSIWIICPRYTTLFECPMVVKNRPPRNGCHQLYPDPQVGWFFYQLANCLTNKYFNMCNRWRKGTRVYPTSVNRLVCLSTNKISNKNTNNNTNTNNNNNNVALATTALVPVDAEVDDTLMTLSNPTHVKEKGNYNNNVDQFVYLCLYICRHKW